MCNYSPPGEYIKDHTLLYDKGWWHLFSISGVKGYSHLYNGNEETVSWSISKDLVNWEFRGHVLHASLRDGEFDQHEIWAPFCLKANNQTYLFYTGIRHPYRPMCFDKLGIHHPQVIWDGHQEALGVAISADLTGWLKISDRQKGIAIPGRDPHVVYDENKKRWLLYSTGTSRNGFCEEYVSQSDDLLNWCLIGVCARFPRTGFAYSTTESITVMRHPRSGKWIMMGNWHYALSDDPVDFTGSEVCLYDAFIDGCNTDRLGFAAETLCWDGKWYRSGVLGIMDHWVLGFHEIEWDEKGAFHVTKPSIVKWQF